jgi:hypothetical protein
MGGCVVAWVVSGVYVDAGVWVGGVWVGEVGVWVGDVGVWVGEAGCVGMGRSRYPQFTPAFLWTVLKTSVNW